MKKLIIFDCDGVLVDSEHLANLALVDCLSELQIKMSVDEATQRFKGRKLSECLLEIERDRSCTLPEDFELTFRQRMSHYFESQLRPIDGVERALKSLPHFKCVASNGPHQKTKRNLEIAGLSGHFGENIFSAYTIQKWKPEPDLFIHACQEMGSEPAQSVVVEDSELGIQAALAGGFRVLAFGLHSSPSADVIPFQSMSELPGLVERILPAGGPPQRR